MSFKENLLKKIEIDRLALLVIASCWPADGRHKVNKEAMRRLLESSPYKYKRERDLDLYLKPIEDEVQMILVLDNELPIFRSTIKDVVVRRDPRTLDLWSFRNIRRILVDSDIKMSVREKSVETVRRDAVALLDLTYEDADIKSLAFEGMGWLEGKDAKGVDDTLSLFAELLGYRKPPKYFGLEHVVCYGLPASKEDPDAAFGPMVLYRPADNNLVWINKSFSRFDLQQIEFLQAVASGRASVSVTGDAVFRTLQEKVLLLPNRILPG